ncbi:MAG: hypothetical protein ACK5LM_03575 [Lactovum sp.]
MQIKNSLYPYLVLSDLDDYQSSSYFTVDYELSQKIAFKNTSLKFNLSYSELEKLTQEGKAVFY